ncbi:Integral membrane protein DUF6, putative [Synechococcus sp. PCC 7335]|uniref:EamA family transporter n=1 Tax=Synechococcus sp. (strain ATCC 29403 / PCC 7335) TaxID=91464 RepID=UPI00017EE7AA|nr:EamA family transporter [Synechococcus sp. PCC 7335]EDX84094.1 Integral membrane protein DUF6, putative [Synechococcus sp. PCC 7335]
MNAEQSWWIFALLSAVFAALTTIFAKAGVESVNSNLATAIRTVVILAVAWGIVWHRGEWRGWMNISRKSMLFLVLSGAATGLSWLCYFRALQLGPASLVAPIDKSGLVLILIFSAVFFGEPLTTKSILGTGLMLAGTLVVLQK